MLDWNRWLPGLGQDQPEEEESAVSKTLKALGQGVSDAGSAVSQGISDAGSAISSGISSAAQTVQDAYAVPTEQRPPQYSGPSYSQPAMGAPQPAQDALTEQVVKPAASLLDAAMGPEGILEPAGGVIRTTGRISDLQNQASGELGRSPIDPRVLDDPGWRARHPDEAAEADSLKQQNTLGLMGQVGEVPRAAQRAAGVLEAAAPAPRPAAVPEPPVRLSNAERMAAADARMAEQGSTAAPGVFGALPDGLPPEPSRQRQTVEVLQEQLDTATSAWQRAREAGDERMAALAREHAVALEGDLVDARNARLELEPRIRSDVGRRVEDLPLAEETADTFSGAGSRPGAASAEDLSGPVGLPVDMSGRANASAGTLPAAGRADPLAAVNRVLSQGVVSSVSGGVGAQVNQEMHPDDPYAGIKGFAAGALVPPLAARGGRALARAAGAVPSPGGGALATAGALPPGGAQPPGPGFFARFPGAQQAMAAAQQRAASMQARGVTPLGPLELARKTAAQVGYSSMIGPTTFTTSMLGGPLEMAWNLPKRAAGAALPKAMGGRGAPAEALAIARGGLAGLGEVGGAIVDALKGTGRYAATPGHEPLSAQIVNPIGHAASSALEAGGRFWSGVPDAIYGTIGRKMGEARAAAEAATNAGLTGTSWRQHVDDLLADAKAVQGGQLPTMSATQDVISAGEKAGKRSTYQDDLGAVGQNVKDVATLAVVPDGKGGRKPVPIVGNMIAPFFNTPWNMEARLAEKVPGVGALMTTQKGFDKAYDQVMGTALVAGMGGYAAAGNITGSGPDDAEKRKMLQAQGWRPYSTNIGGYYIPNRALGEFGPLLNAVGDAHDAMTYSEDKDFPAVASNFGARIGKQMQERVWLQGLSELIGALEAGQQGGLGAGAERYAASLATRMVPYAATARTIGTALDPQGRTTERGKETTVGQRIGQQVQRGLGLGQGVPSLGIAPLPVEQDILGRPQANPQQGAGALFPRVGVEKPEPISKAYLEGGVDIGGPPPTIGGIALTPAQQRRWNAARGQALQQARADILAARTLPKADRQAELRRILSEASADARDTVEPTFTERQRRDAERKAS